MAPSELLYEGKAKKIFKDAKSEQTVILEFKDSLTAFNAQKKGSFENKGGVNRDIATVLFKYLSSHGINSHFIEDVGSISQRVKKVRIFPLEVVVRNVMAGSTAKKLGIPDGQGLENPLVEFYYKNDQLEDPFVSDDQILMMKIATQKDLEVLKAKALQINHSLKKLFAQCDIRLIDFKVEFGLDTNSEIILADEITPDCCRLWDLKTQEKLDKDRFRKDLGLVKESYEEVLKRLKNAIGGL